MTPAEEAELAALIRAAAWRERIAAGCLGKQGFQNAADARKTIRPHAQGVVHPYRCQWCGLWHVGSANRPRRLVIEKRRARV